MLDQSIRSESGASLTLAPSAMTSIDNERCSLQAISGLPAGAASFHGKGRRGIHVWYEKPKSVENIRSTLTRDKMAGQILVDRFSLQSPGSLGR